MIVFVYGYAGSGPDHWQRWLAAELARRGQQVAFPELPDPESPHKEVWVGELRRWRDRSSTPVLFVCHSLGCWAVDHLLAGDGSDNVRGALLVAPPSPYLLFEPVESFLPPPQRREAWAPIAASSLMVGSDNDDFTSAEELAEIAARLGMPLHLIPAAGHINTASGYGPWPFALEWVLRASPVRTR